MPLGAGWGTRARESARGRPHRLTEANDISAAFTFKLNGKRVFGQAANWVPNDRFPGPVDEARYRQRLERAAAADVDPMHLLGCAALARVDRVRGETRRHGASPIRAAFLAHAAWRRAQPAPQLQVHRAAPQRPALGEQPLDRVGSG